MTPESIERKSISNDSIVDILNSLIEVCRNGHDGYLTAAEGINAAAYKTLFAEYALERSRFAAQLANMISTLGGEPGDDGITNAWTNIQAAVNGGDNGTIFDVCEHGEDAASNEYVRALENQLPPQVYAVVFHQYEQIVEAHDRVRNLRDAYRAQHSN